MHGRIRSPPEGHRPIEAYYPPRQTGDGPPGGSQAAEQDVVSLLDECMRPRPAPGALQTELAAGQSGGAGTLDPAQELAARRARLAAAAMARIGKPHGAPAAPADALNPRRPDTCQGGDVIDLT